MDPSWSPDGKRLAFTLFGSIWIVDAAGGEARQVSGLNGYHAHPAWSPKGDWIAYIQGSSPAGPLPNISGRLVVVNPSTGEERVLQTPQNTAGTPAWSADGSRIFAGLAVPDSGSLLHEIPLSGGAVRRVQQRPQRGPSGGWIFAAGSPRPDEVFTARQHFGAVQNGSQMLGAPQILSDDVSSRPIRASVPLTRFRLTDIAQLHSLSPLPDGSGVVYSAVLVNGKGDRELYRVGRDGAAPVALTNTSRDEMSPSVSPDGGRVAYVSNHLGNTDLFVRSLAGGEATHVRIARLRFKRPQARLKIRTLDEKGQPSPVRLYLRAADGKAYAPQGAQLFYYFLEPGQPREGFFITQGEEEVVLPAGLVRLAALKGIEYRNEERSLDLAPDQTTEITIAMSRWTNWEQRGWYTGENHFHANYNGIYYQKPPDSLSWLEAEDLNTANMIVANSEGAFVHDKEFFTGGVSTASKPRFALYWGQEYRNSDPLGHMAFLNIRKQVPPSYTSVVGSNSPFDFPLNTMAAEEARKQGGVVVYVHPMGGLLTDVMDTNLGAKEAPLTAAAGAMDGIDVLPFGPAAYELWYRLLNCGFRIAPGAGTDVFTNWRGINNIPGSARQYVQTGSTFTWDNWITNYRAGRVFVTNGPLLSFDVNGQGPGSVIPAPAGDGYRVKLAVEFNSRLPVNSVELIQNGKVIEQANLPAGTNTHRIEKEVTLHESAWFAARVAGPPVKGNIQGARAHSGVVSVQLGGQPVVVREDVELMVRWLNSLWMYLEERNNFGPAGNRQKARAYFERALAVYKARL
jgi:hypothetical protein